MWAPTTIPGSVDSGDGTAGEYGFRFRSDLPGTITSLRFYKGTANTGSHSAHLWSNTGTLLATATFSGEGSSGWQQVDFSTPVAITANTTYVASYFAPNGHYSDNGSYFLNTFDNAPLHALQNGLDGANGIYHYGTASAFPTSTFGSTNYWVDVVFLPNASTTPPTVTSVTPAANSTGVALNTAVSAKFSEPMNASTISGTTFLLMDSSNNLIPSSVAYNSSTTTATLTPTAPLTSGTAYTATVKSGANGVKDFSGNAMAADVVWSFTAVADTTPPTVTSVVPASGATGVATTTSVNAVFSEAVNATTVNTTTVQLLGPGNSLVAATVTYASASQTATLQPSAALTASTVYSVVVNGVKDLAGNTMAASFNSSFTTAAVVTPPTNCPCSVWTATTTPATVDSGDGNSIEVGFRFRSDVSGTITGMRFYKSAANSGTHTGNLWTNTGTLLGSVTFTSETASGWQQVNFSTPVAISANTTYVASYFAPAGHYSANSSFFVTGVDNRSAACPAGWRRRS